MPYAPPGHERECDVGAEQGLPAFAAQRAEQAAVARLPCAHLAANTAINAAAAPRFDTALIPAPFGWWHGNLRGTSGRLGSGCSSVRVGLPPPHACTAPSGCGRGPVGDPCGALVSRASTDRNLRRRRLAPRPTAHGARGHCPRAMGPMPTLHAHARALALAHHPHDPRCGVAPR